MRRFGGGSATPRGYDTASRIEGQSLSPEVVETRVLPIAVAGSGKRNRDWKDVDESIKEEAASDWPIDGPRTVAWCATFFRKRLCPSEHHQAWKTACGLKPEQWAVQENQLLCNLLELAGSYDQLNIANLAWAEAAARKVQTIEWAYHDKLRDSTQAKSGGRLDAKEVVAFSGMGRTCETLCVAPSLLSHVKEIVEKDAAILKHLRKAREEREERAKKKS